MSNEEEKKCPLCAEEMDWTDQQLNPCKCGYEVCVWCWNHITGMAEKDATEGRCPACRTPYDKDRIVGLEANFQRVVGNGSNRKQKLQKPKSKSSEGRTDLSNVRVVQRRMAYIIGLPLDLADEDILKQKDLFGQYGKVTKVSLSRTAGGTIQQFMNDTCSVYITFSKEEEAVTCIQSVHGYVLDGRLLRASFGTAKYCHAWLRNTPCNNPSCLYLHAMGAEEDSFGKDEAAAVHTRNRVQEIVGGTHYVHRRSGSMLPPPVVEQFNDDSALSEEPVYNDGLKDVASTDQLPARSSNQMTTFVDIVGRSSSSTSSKDVSSVEEERILSAWSDSNQVETESSDSVVLKSSTPNQLVNSPTFDDQISKDSVGSSQKGSFISSFPATTTKNSGDESWWHTECHNQISHVDKEDNIPVPVMNSVLNDGYNEKKFQSSAKSDRIYRGSNSFSNEEIVEHLRKLDHDDDTLVDNDENSAAVESSIISDILSMDLDGNDDPVYHHQTVARNGRIDSSWNFQNDHSRFSFPTEHAFSNQQNDLISPRNISQGLTFSVQDSYENKNVVYKSRHQASRPQNLTPPGFSSAPSKPPPGFSACLRTEQAIAASSGNYVRVAPIAHYRSPLLGNPSNSSDDLIDLSTIVGGAKSSTNGLLTNSWPSSISSRCSSSFEDDTKNWLFMQQHSGPQFSQANIHQHHTTPQFTSSRDNFFGGLTSKLDLNCQSYTPSLFTQQPNFSGTFQQHNNLQETQQLGFNSFLPGYGDYMFQLPYTQVFGM